MYVYALLHIMQHINAAEAVAMVTNLKSVASYIIV